MANLDLISIHAPVKGATTGAISAQVSMCNFNPRSREGSDTPLLNNSTIFVNFNPRSREGSDCSSDKDRDTELISIHAPVKGATQSGLRSAYS